MCLILISYKMHPQYRLVIAANRDEFYDRPTLPARFWKTSPDILAGKDLERGGTWMGINRAGHFAAVTNYREPQTKVKSPASRGHLVRDYLLSGLSALDYLKKIRTLAGIYDGFNLLAGTMEDLYYFSNRQNNILKLPPGILGLSNHLLNTPWPKVKKAKQFFKKVIMRHQSLDMEGIFDLLKDKSVPPDELLPSTGVDFQWEKILSPIFVSSRVYGTRSSTVLFWDHQGKIDFLERTFNIDQGRIISCDTRKFSFLIQRLSR